MTPRSLVWATDVDVLPPSRTVTRRDGYLVVRSPSNPTHYWGNLLLFDTAPTAGDRERWEQAFAEEFADLPDARHRTFGWDLADGDEGAAGTEFEACGYRLERSVGLIADAAQLRPHPRENREVSVRPLDPEPSADGAAWEQVAELHAAARDPEIDEHEHRAFTAQRLADWRKLFRAGRGAWYVAELDGQVVGSCGIVVTAGRGRYQAVDTAGAHRRRGICSRLLVSAAAHAADAYAARRMAIAADPGYHALGLYESLGFSPVERVSGVLRRRVLRRPEG